MIIFIARKIDWRSLGGILSHLDARWALPAWAATFFMIPLLAFRWRIFLEQQNVAVRPGTVFRLAWAGQFFNSVLPGSVGGDVVKVYQLCSLFPGHKAAIAGSVVADRLTALFALLLLAGIGFLASPLPLQMVLGREVPPGSTWLWIAAACGLAAIATWIGWHFLRSSRVAARIRRVVAAVRQCFADKGKFAAAFSFALALHLLNFTLVFLFAKALGLTLTYGQVLVMMPVLLIVIMLPITINGHGLRELLLIAYFGAMGVTVAGHPTLRVQDAAVALSLLSVANDLAWSLPGGLWYLLRTRRPAQRPDLDQRPVT